MRQRLRPSSSSATRMAMAASSPNRARCISRVPAACAGNTNRRTKNSFSWMAPTCGFTFQRTTRPVAQNFRESSDWRTPLALLAGKADLGKFCRSVSIDDPATNPASKPDDRPTDPGNTVLRCLPRGQAPTDPGDAEGSAIREVLFESTPDAHLVRVLIRQPGNLETEFRFGDWHENIAIPETKFHFVPPPGVSIVDEAKMAAEPQ